MNLVVYKPAHCEDAEEGACGQLSVFSVTNTIFLKLVVFLRLHLHQFE